MSTVTEFSDSCNSDYGDTDFFIQHQQEYSVYCIKSLHDGFILIAEIEFNRKTYEAHWIAYIRLDERHVTDNLDVRHGSACSIYEALARIDNLNFTKERDLLYKKMIDQSRGSYIIKDAGNNFWMPHASQLCSSASTSSKTRRVIIGKSIDDILIPDEQPDALFTYPIPINKLTESIVMARVLKSIGINKVGAYEFKIIDICNPIAIPFITFCTSLNSIFITDGINIWPVIHHEGAMFSAGKLFAEKRILPDATSFNVEISKLINEL